MRPARNHPAPSSGLVKRQDFRLHTTLRLTQEGIRQFLAAINNPPEPNEHLRALVREFGADHRQ